MNAKSLVLIIFCAWSVLCWQWYVCGIMGACSSESSATPELTMPPLAANKAVETPEIEAVEQHNSTDNSSVRPLSSDAPASADRMNEIQVVEVRDKMLIYYPYKSAKKEENGGIDTYLQNLAEKLKQSGAKVTITGHTDFVGEPEENYRFGLLRANGIREILIHKGVSASQISCQSMGDRKPAATNDTPYGRYLNRRVEIRITPN